MPHALTPVSTNPNYIGGPLHIYEAAESALLASGLIEPHDVPGQRPGCKNTISHRDPPEGHLKTYRMRDGRVRLTISASLARQRDHSFVDFLAGACAPYFDFSRTSATSE